MRQVFQLLEVPSSYKGLSTQTVSLTSLTDARISGPRLGLTSAFYRKGIPLFSYTQVPNIWDRVPQLALSVIMWGAQREVGGLQLR